MSEKTIREEPLTAFLSGLGGDTGELYREIASALAECGYAPKKAKSSISFKHGLHNKQIAKMGVRINKKDGAVPFFALRFSACDNFSERFKNIVYSYVTKYPHRSSRCMDGGGCSFCAGDAASHVYACALPDGETGFHCGAYAVEIPNVTLDDLDEIKSLILEEHGYLMKHEAGRS